MLAEKTHDELKGGSGTLSKAQSRLILALLRGAVLYARKDGTWTGRVPPGTEVIKNTTIESLYRRGYLIREMLGNNSCRYTASSRAKHWAKSRS